MTAIYFDLDGTLVHHAISFEEMFERARRKLDVLDHDDLYDRYQAIFLDYFADCHSEPYRAAMNGLRTEFDLATDGETFAEALVEVELAHTEVATGTRELLQTLADDHVLGVLTNGAGRVQRTKLETHGLDRYFDAVVASCEVGVGKPDAEIFETATEKLSGSKFAFVADDLERDVLPAQQAGFTGVFLSESTDSRADVCIADLSDVRNVLG